MAGPRSFFFVFFALLCSSAAFAQIPNATDTTATPAPGAHDYLHSPVETVNPANGSVSIRIPVRMPQGRQLTVPFSFAYDSNGAFYIGEHPQGSAPFYLTTTTAIGSEGGWSYSYPVLSFGSGTWQIPGSLDNMITCHGSTNYVFQDPNGNRHNLGLSVSANLASPNGVDNCNEGIGQDGEFYSSTQDPPASAPGPILATTTIPDTNTNVFPGVTVVDGDGTTYDLPGGGPGTNGLTTLARSVTDRNGNVVTISNASGVVTYTDTIGRPVLSSSGMGANPDTITAGGSTYHVYWTTTSASFPLSMLNLAPGQAGSQNCPTSMSGGASVISSIVLPDGRQFTFYYDNLNGNDPYGMLREIKYPSGGYVRYVWGLSHYAEVLSWGYSANNSSYSYTCRYDFPAITDRYVSFDGSTEVLHQQFQYYTDWSDNTTSTWNYKQTIVTTNDLLRGTSFATTYKYSPLAAQWVPNCGSCSMTQQVPTEQVITYGDIGGGTLRTVTKSWKNIRLLQSEQTALDNGQSSLKVYCYNNWEEITEADEYDLGTSVPNGACATVPSGAQSGPLLRKTATTYATFTPHIVDLPATVITYDGLGNRVAETDSPSYDANGNLLTQTKDCFSLANGVACTQGNATTTYTYDSHGQITSIKDPNLNTTQFSYADSYSGCGGTAPPSGPSDAYLTQVTYPQTNGVNHIVSYCYDYTLGLLRSSTDQNNQTTSYAYNDALDRLTQATYPAGGGQTTYSYNDLAPNPTETTTKEINSSQNLIAVTTMNGLGDPVQTQLTSDPQGTVTTLAQFDGMGRTYKAYNPTRCSPATSNCGESTWGLTTYVYDALGRTKTVTKPDNSVVSTAYSGNCTTVTDEELNTRESCTNGLGQMAQVIESPGVLNWETDYTYDALDDLKTVVQGGSRNRSFAYSSLKQLIQSTNPESGTINYTYDADGNVLTKADARGITSTYSFDALNRVTGVTYSNGDPALTFSYDQTGQAACLGQSSCANVGHRTSMSDAGGSESFAYDNMGREVADQRITNSLAPKTTVYAYDFAGDATKIIYPTGDRIVDYTYDSAGRASTAHDDLSGAYYVKGPCATGGTINGACYAPQSAISQIENGGNVFTTYVYNNRLQPCWIFATTGTALPTNTLCSASDPGNAVLDLQYNFNAGHDNGNVLGITNKRDATRSQSFSYDQVNRIVSAQTSGTTGSNCWGETYSYDQWANLQSIGTASGYSGCPNEGTWGATPNASNQLPSLTYDAGGNTLGDGLNIYQWNAEGELKFAAGVNYTYDGDGNRVSKSTGETYWHGLGGEILGETDGQGNTTDEYIFFGGKRVAHIAY